MDDDPSINPGAGGPGPDERLAASGMVSLQYAEANRRAAAKLLLLSKFRTWVEADEYFEDKCDKDLYESMKEALMASEELDSAAAGGRRKKKRKHLGGVNPITMFITIIDAVCASATKFKRNVGAQLQILMNGTVARIMATGGDPELAKKTAGYIWAASKYLVGAVAVRALSNDLAKGTTGVTGLVVLTVIRSILLLVPDNALQAVPGVLEIARKTGGVVGTEILENKSKYVAAIVAALGVKAIGSLTEKANRQTLYTRISQMFGPLEGLFEQEPFDEAVQGLAVALESANLAPKPVISPGILPRTKLEAVAKAGAAAAAAAAAAKRPSPTPAEIEERKKASKAAFVASMKQFFDTHRDRTPDEIASDAAIEASLAEAAAAAKAAADAAPKEQVVAAVEEAKQADAGYQAAEAAEQERADLREGDLAKEDSAAARRLAERAAAAGTGLTDMSAKPKVEGGKRRKSTRKVRRSARRSFRRSARRLSRRKRMNKA